MSSGVATRVLALLLAGDTAPPDSGRPRTGVLGVGSGWGSPGPIPGPRASGEQRAAQGFPTGTATQPTPRRACFHADPPAALAILSGGRCAPWKDHGPLAAPIPVSSDREPPCPAFPGPGSPSQDSQSSQSSLAALVASALVALPHLLSK